MDRFSKRMVLQYLLLSNTTNYPPDSELPSTSLYSGNEWEQLATKNIKVNKNIPNGIKPNRSCSSVSSKSFDRVYPSKNSKYATGQKIGTLAEISARFQNPIKKPPCRYFWPVFNKAISKATVKSLQIIIRANHSLNPFKPSKVTPTIKYKSASPLNFEIHKKHLNL